MAPKLSKVEIFTSIQIGYLDYRTLKLSKRVNFRAIKLSKPTTTSTLKQTGEKIKPSATKNWIFRNFHKVQESNRLNFEKG
jgi:hypothetical protein